MDTVRSFEVVFGLAMLAACGPDGAANARSPSPAAAPSPRSAATKPSLVLADLRAWDAATSAERRAAAESLAARENDFRLVKLERFSCGGQTHEVAICSHEKSGLEFVAVPAGTFEMGSPEGEKHRRSEETQHRVTLANPFLIARTLCTQAAYEKVSCPNPSVEDKGPTFPVDLVTWDDAKAFCGKAGLALPTEAEWEYARRAGTTTAYSFGANFGRGTLGSRRARLRGDRETFEFGRQWRRARPGAHFGRARPRTQCSPSCA